MKCAFLGDICFEGKYSLDHSSNAKERLLKVANFLEGYDYVVGNLEAPFTNKKRTLIAKSTHLSSSLKNIELLKFLHINAVNLANNHMYDFGAAGLADTIRVLENNRIEWFGANDKTLLVRKDNSLLDFSGFCCYTTNGPGLGNGKNKNQINCLSYKYVMDQVKRDHKYNYLSILNLHMGEEYTMYPNSIHRKMIRKLAAENKVIVCGHHPHVVQGIEKISDSLAAYSLGNFIFDFDKTDPYYNIEKFDLWKKSFIWEVTIENNNMIASKIIGIEDGLAGIEFIDISKEIETANTGLAMNQVDKYEKLRSDQIKSARKMIYLPHDFKWYLSKMNYSAIGAKLLTKVYKKKYDTVLKKYL